MQPVLGFLAQNFLYHCFQNAFISIYQHKSSCIRPYNKVTSIFTSLFKKTQKVWIKLSLPRFRLLLLPQNCTTVGQASGNSFSAERQDSLDPSSMEYTLIAAWQELSSVTQWPSTKCGHTQTDPGTDCIWARARSSSTKLCQAAGSVWTAQAVCVPVGWNRKMSETMHSWIAEPPSCKNSDVLPLWGPVAGCV